MSKEKINELIKFYAEWRDEHKASLDEGTVRAINNWRGNFRFDVVDVYGDGEGEGAPVEIDHIVNAPLFPPKWRFW